MTKRNIIIVTGICLVVVLSVVCVQYLRSTAKDVTAMADAIAVTPFQAGKGWGYKVSIEGKPFINQDIIPGLPGNLTFNSREDALRVGLKVAEKIKQRQIPAVTRQELIEMKISAAME
jgi:hypothetical protein